MIWIAKQSTGNTHVTTPCLEAPPHPFRALAHPSTAFEGSGHVLDGNAHIIGRLSTFLSLSFVDLQAVHDHLRPWMEAHYTPEGSSNCASIAERSTFQYRACPRAERSAPTDGSLKSVRLAPARASSTKGAKSHKDGEPEQDRG